MIKRFLFSGRSRFYFSVPEPGALHEILSRDPNRVTVAGLKSQATG
jgi:hypothetical protein